MGSQQGQAELLGNPGSPGQLRTHRHQCGGACTKVSRQLLSSQTLHLLVLCNIKAKIHHLSKCHVFGGFNLAKPRKTAKDERGFDCWELLEPPVPGPASTTGDRFL